MQIRYGSTSMIDHVCVGIQWEGKELVEQIATVMQTNGIDSSYPESNTQCYQGQFGHCPYANRRDTRINSGPAERSNM